MPQSELIQKIGRIHVPVRDIAASVGWYGARLGLHLLQREVTHADLQVYDGETKLRLVGSPDECPRTYIAPDQRVPHFNLYTMDAPATRRELISRSVPLTNAVETTLMHYYEAIDPDGNYVGVCHEKEGSLYYTPSDGRSVDVFERILAVFVPVRDMARAIDWYTGILGLNLIKHNSDFADLRVGKRETLLTLIRCRDHVPRTKTMEHFVLESSDIWETHASLRQREPNVTEIAESVSGAQCSVVDPDGNRIGVEMRTVAPSKREHVFV